MTALPTGRSTLAAAALGLAVAAIPATAAETPPLPEPDPVPRGLAAGCAQWLATAMSALIADRRRHGLARIRHARECGAVPSSDGARFTRCRDMGTRLADGAARYREDLDAYHRAGQAAARLWRIGRDDAMAAARIAALDARIPALANELGSLAPAVPGYVQAVADWAALPAQRRGALAVRARDAFIAAALARARGAPGRPDAAASAAMTRHLRRIARIVGDRAAARESAAYPTTGAAFARAQVLWRRRAAAAERNRPLLRETFFALLAAPEGVPATIRVATREARLLPAVAYGWAGAAMAPARLETLLALDAAQYRRLAARTAQYVLALEKRHRLDREKAARRRLRTELAARVPAGPCR